MSISVVIPAYNGVRFVAETIESVLAQTLPADEVLVIDDGSTDDTAAIAEGFAPRVRVFRRSNQRTAAARNFGVEQATGEWIAFVDHDDLWEPHKLERQMAELARHPEADLCYTGFAPLIKKGNSARIGKVYEVPPAEDIRRSLYRTVTFLPSSIVIRRSTFVAVNGFDTKIYKSEDYDMWLRLLHAGVKFAACREPLFQRRLHEGNTAKNLAWFDESMGVYRKLVLPYLPSSTGWITYLKYLSEHEGDAAYTLRRQGNSAHLAMMAESVFHWPFNDPYRYKVLLHMLYTRLKNQLNRLLPFAR